MYDLKCFDDNPLTMLGITSMILTIGSKCRSPNLLSMNMLSLINKG